MVSELICIAILQFMRRRSPSVGASDAESIHQDAASPKEIYLHLLGRYQLSDIDAALRWLELTNYISLNKAGSGFIVTSSWYVLTDKGLRAADRNEIDEEDKEFLYQEEDPYAAFVAHQFNPDDTDLVAYIRDEVLQPQGFTILEGRADGLEPFRTAILDKIRRARFFLCLLTKRIQLASGTFVSSVWLYQEIGAAVAYGKKPVILLEEGIDKEYVGKLQSIYQYSSFTRSNHPQIFKPISQQFLIDLDDHLIPRPPRPPAES
jgi:hypothetical protein